MGAFPTTRTHSGIGVGGEFTVSEEADLSAVAAIAASTAGHFLRKTGVDTYESVAAAVMATATTGTDFSISTSGTAHTFNLPDASATARGVINTGTQTIAGDKTFSGAILFTGSTSGAGPSVPGTTTDNAIVRWDGTTGTALQDYTSNAPTITDAGSMTLNADLFLANAVGVVIGHSTQLVLGEVTAETQIIGTDETDGSLVILVASETDALAPILKLVKNANATVGTFTTSVADNEELGKIQAYGTDGSDADTLIAEIGFVVDDASITGGQIGGEILFSTATSGGTLTEVVRIDSDSEVHVTGHIDLDHTATANDTHSLEVATDAAGFGDVKSLDIVYDTGTLSTGEDAAVILVNINELDATGGSVAGIEFLATTGGADDLHAILVGAGIDPIEQESGTFANPTTGTNNTASTDVAAMIDGSTGTNTTIWVNDNDFIIIGAAAAFTEIQFVMNTVAGNPGLQPTFAYSTTGSGNFTTFSPIDGTNGFRNSGVVAWEASDLTSHATNSDTGTFDIRITRTSNNQGSLSLFYAQTAATVVLSWNAAGVITSSGLVVGTGTTSVFVVDDISALTGANNTIAGSGAGAALTSGARNTFFGFEAGAAAINDNDSTFVGYQAGRVNVGQGVTAVGSGALDANTTGGSNTAIGLNALGALVGSNEFNTAVGATALLLATGGAHNTAIGNASLDSLTTANFNTALGSRSMQDNQTGASNTAVGYFSLNNVTAGGNTALGESAGDLLTTGSGNIILGHDADPSANDATNEFVAGSATQAITNVYFGEGVADATPPAYTINGTGGSGTDTAGATLNLAGGKATGAALGGSIVLQTSVVGSSGSTLQSLTARLTIDLSGHAVFAAGTTPADVAGTPGTAHFGSLTATGGLGGNTTISSTGVGGIGGGGLFSPQGLVVWLLQRRRLQQVELGERMPLQLELAAWDHYLAQVQKRVVLEVRSHLRRVMAVQWRQEPGRTWVGHRV